MLMFYMGHVIWQMLIKTVEPERTGHFRSFELHRELIQTVLKAFNVFQGRCGQRFYNMHSLPPLLVLQIRV